MFSTVGGCTFYFSSTFDHKNCAIAESTPQKAKKLKKRNFQVVTLVFLEKPVTPDDDDNDDEDDGGKSPKAYDALVREVWAPIDDVRM